MSLSLKKQERLRELVEIINSSLKERVNLEDGKIIGPEYLIRYIKDKLDGTINQPINGFKPQLLYHPQWGCETRYIVEKSGDVFFITRLIKCEDEINSVNKVYYLKRLKVIKKRFLSSISDVNHITMKEGKMLVEEIERDEVFGL